MSDNSEKVILITGSSSGIGAATAEAFAREWDARLVITGRNADRVAEVANRCKKASFYGKDPLQIPNCDLTQDGQAERLITETVSKLGRIDVLVNSAGLITPLNEQGMLAEKFMDEHNAIFATNVSALVNVTRLAVPHLKATKGNVINLSSVASETSATVCMSYCMSKAAVDMFTRAASLNLAKYGIRVNGICPGPVESEMNRTLWGDTPEKLDSGRAFAESLTPLGRVGKPQEVAELILFLTDNARAGWLTGENVKLDGGFANMSAFEIIGSKNREALSATQRAPPVHPLVKVDLTALQAQVGDAGEEEDDE